MLHSVGRYLTGQTQIDEPNEKKRQQELKSLLDAISSENYDTILSKILAAGNSKAVTLQGLVDQVQGAQPKLATASVFKLG